MMRLRFAFVLAACVSLAPALAAADDAPTYTQPPKPDFSSMNFLVGTWTCSTKSARRPTAVASTDTYAIDSTGYYLVWDSKSDAVPWAPFPVEQKSMNTYDSELKQWASVGTSNIGDYNLWMSDGWTDGKLVWHPVNNTPNLDVASVSDYTVTKVSDTKITSFSTFATKSGKTVAVNETCTKSL